MHHCTACRPSVSSQHPHTHTHRLTCVLQESKLVCFTLHLQHQVLPTASGLHSWCWYAGSLPGQGPWAEAVQLANTCWRTHTLPRAGRVRAVSQTPAGSPILGPKLACQLIQPLGRNEVLAAGEALHRVSGGRKVARAAVAASCRRPLQAARVHGMRRGAAAGSAQRPHANNTMLQVMFMLHCTVVPAASAHSHWLCVRPPLLTPRTASRRHCRFSGGMPCAA